MIVDVIIIIKCQIMDVMWINWRQRCTVVDVDADVDVDVDVDEDGALTRDTCIADLKIRGLNTAPTRALVMLPTPHMSHAETADLICPSSSGIQLQ